jgi:hypothetical protein
MYGYTINPNKSTLLGLFGGENQEIDSRRASEVTSRAPGSNQPPNRTEAGGRE